MTGFQSCGSDADKQPQPQRKTSMSPTDSTSLSTWTPQSATMLDLPLRISKTLLRKRHPPNSEELEATERLLAQAERRLQAVEDEILRLQQTSHGLSLKKAALASFIDSHRQLLSPSQRLPPDILAEIFYHCLPKTHNAIMSIHEPPLSLGSVCSRWRQIVYSTPQLWTSIHIVTTPLSPSERDAARRHAVSSWLSRSGILPLSISIHLDLSGPPPLGQTTNSIIQGDIDIITPYAHRWKSIRSRIPDVDWLGVLSKLGARGLPLLEHLDVESFIPRNIVAWGEPPDTTRLSDAFSILCREEGVLYAPKLRALALPVVLANQLQMRMRWECLTGLELRFGHLHITTVLQVLSRCVNLVDCKFSIISSWGPWEEGWMTPPTPPSPDPLTLEALQSLSLDAGATRSGLVNRTLELLSCPALRHLSYQGRVRRSRRTRAPSLSEETAFIRCLWVFLQKLVKPLEELNVTFDAMHEQKLFDILYCVPGVKRLSVKGELLSHMEPRGYPYTPPLDTCPISISLLKYLTPGSDTLQRDTPELFNPTGEDGAIGKLCPKLELLSLSDISLSVDILMKFLRSRTVDCQRHEVALLRALNINFSSLDSTALEQGQGLHGLREEIAAIAQGTGVQVSLQFPKSGLSAFDILPAFPLTWFPFAGILPPGYFTPSF